MFKPDLIKTHNSYDRSETSKTIKKRLEIIKTRESNTLNHFVNILFTNGKLNDFW